MSAHARNECTLRRHERARWHACMHVREHTQEWHLCMWYIISVCIQPRAHACASTAACRNAGASAEYNVKVARVACD
eukprot:4423589-Pleurochrysis_carterae.AAC.1